MSSFAAVFNERSFNNQNRNIMRSRTAEWFECKIRYEKTMEDGMQKKVTETYTVDALSFTEAEQRIIEEMSAYISGEFDVADIKKAAYKRFSSATKTLPIVGISASCSLLPSMRKQRKRNAPTSIILLMQERSMEP